MNQNRKVIHFSSTKCVNCYACIIACKLKHNFQPYPDSLSLTEPEGISRISIHPSGPELVGDTLIYHFQPIACLHCEEAACIEGCPESAIYKDYESGATLVDREACTGCKQCLELCPYNIPRYDEDGKIALCDMCIDRLRVGEKTACEAACPAKAIYFRELKNN